MKKGERIKKLREEKGYTLEELGKLIGVSKQTIGKYESEIITNIPSDKIEALAEIFNVSPAYIMGWIEQEVIPRFFVDPKEARKYVMSHAIFGSDGLNVSKMDDEEIVEFANELMKQMEMVSYKYRK